MSCAILEKILYFFFEETIFVMKKKFNHSEYILPVLKLFMFLFWVLETAIFRMYCCPKKEVRKLLSINGSNVVKLQVNLKDFFFFLNKSGAALAELSLTLKHKRKNYHCYIHISISYSKLCRWTNNQLLRLLCIIFLRLFCPTPDVLV